MSALASRLAGAANLRVLAGLAVAVGVLGMQSGGGTLAFFTSTATSTQNAFTSGSVTLKLSDNDESSLSSVTASMTAGSNLAPGTTKLAGFIDVLNTGSLELRYQMRTTDNTSASTANTAFNNALTAGIDSIAASGPCAATQGGAQTQVVAAGAALRTIQFGDLAANTGPTLAATTGSSRLCFYVTLPSGTVDAAQGGQSEYAFTFTAEQTLNNP